MKVKILFFVFYITMFFVFSIAVSGQTSSITETTDSAVTPKQRSTIQEQRDLILRNKRETRTMIKDRKEEFKEKIKIIRDEKKSALVEKIDEKISTKNKTYTAKLSALLEKLELVLSRIFENGQNLKSRGIDASSLDSAITDARTAIDAAKIAVTNQAAKIYNIEISSESTLRATVGESTSQFRKDLKDTHKAVIEAKQAVMKTKKELAKLRREQKEKSLENQK